MTLEQQVCSLELAKRLKELGVKQDQSLFWWTGSAGYYEIKTTPWAMGNGINISQQIGETYSAFTVAELGEILPRYIEHDGFSLELQIIRLSVWRFYYGKEIFLTTGNDDTEADARAKMLIYLLENNLCKTSY